MCLLVQHNNAGLRVSFSYIRKKPKCRNVEAAGSLKISSTPRDWTVQNADVPCTRSERRKKKGTPASYSDVGQQQRKQT